MWQRLLFETVQEIYVAKTSVGDCLGDICGKDFRWRFLRLFGRYMWQRLRLETLFRRYSYVARTFVGVFSD